MRCATKGGQTGAALLLMLLVVVVAASAVLVHKLGERDLKRRQLDNTRAALAAAKQALIDYAATFPDIAPGAAAQLPCPDIDATGTWPAGAAHTASCGGPGVTVLGRLPWRTLGVDIPRDASGSCLWYVVSGSYKNATAATPPLINPDSNGQLEVYSIETGALLEGALAEERPVALLLAPLAPLPGQARTGAATPGCSDDFGAADFLDADAGLGISNAALSGAPDTIDQFAVASGFSEQHNDQLLSLSRAELAAAVYGRHDFAVTMATLTRGVASCIAAYGLGNPGGAGDRRLPWPAPTVLATYAADGEYDDADTGVLSGRLADRVDDSSAQTGSAIGRVLADCDPASAPDWDPAYLALWQNWKDHFFYAVAESYQPGAPLPTGCGACLSVNGAGNYAAIVLFAGPRLEALGQRRNAPPLDADTKGDIVNYLEGANAANHPYTGGSADFVSQPETASFNDVAYCIDTAMTVAAC